MGVAYTDQQQGIIDKLMGYGYQADPLEMRFRKYFQKYQTGNDPKGKLTAFLKPMRVAAGVQREGAVDDYTQENAAGFNQGGGALTAGATAELRREYDKDEGDREVSAYTQRGEGIADRLERMFNDSKSRELQAYGIAGGVANSPHKTYGWGDFLTSVLQGGASVAAAAAGAP